MPGKHTSKEKRKARHIEKGYEKKGVSQSRSRAPRLGDGQQARLIKPLSRKTFENFDPAIQCAKLAMRELRQAAFERCIGNRWIGKMLFAELAEPQSQTAPVVRVRLPVDQSRANQSVDCPADCGSAALNPRRNLVEGRRFLVRDRGK